MQDKKLELLNNDLETISFANNEFEKKIKQSLKTIFSAPSYNETKTSLFLNQKQTYLLTKNENLAKDYKLNIENLNKAFVIALEKNKNQIQKYYLDAENNISVLKKAFYLERHQLNKEIIDAEIRNIKTLTENHNFYDEEVDQIKLEIKQRSEESNIVNQRYENEKQLKLKTINDKFIVHKKEFEEQESLISTKYQTNVLQLKDLLKDELANKDNTYLTIKKTHSQSSVKFNNFINTISANNRLLIQENINKYQELVDRVDLDLSKELDIHETNKSKIQHNSFEKIKALNIVFDVQKDVYNQKTNEIIEANNIEVTKINSQLRIKRDELNKQIDTLEKEKWNKLTKAKNQDEKNLLSKDFNKQINQLKVLILELISQNKLELGKQEVKFQTNLFNHDYEHVKQINEWRYSKNLYDMERKLEIEQEVLRYEQVLFEKDEKKKMYSMILSIKQDIQKLETEEDLLPIESQLHLASSLQNREINLLNQEFESNKLNNELNQKLLNQQKMLEILPLKHELNIHQTKKEKESRIIELTYQLEINKEILKRDIFVSNLNLNLDLQKILLENKNKRANQDLKSIISINNIKIEQLTNNLNYQSETINKTAEIEEQKRNAIIQEIKIKNQKFLNNKQNHKNIALSKNTVESREDIAHYFVDQFLNGLTNEKDLVLIILKLLKSEVHPETIRSLIELSSSFVEYNYNNSIDILKSYFNNSKNHFESELNNLTTSKYQLKYDEIVNLYNDNMRVINIGREDLLSKQKVLNEENIIIENKIIQNKELIRIYLKNIVNEDDRKVAKKQVFTLENENNLLTKTAKANNKVLKSLEKEIKPLDLSVENFAKQKYDSENSVTKEKTLEEYQYKYLFRKLERDFDRLYFLLEKHKTKVIKTYQVLLDKIHLNDSEYLLLQNNFKSTYEKLFSFSIDYSQKILSFWLQLYLIAEKEQLNIIDNFDTYTINTTNQIKDSFSKFILIEEKAQVILTTTFNTKNNDLNERINYLTNKLNAQTTSNHKDYNHFYHETEVKIEQNLKSRNNNFALINENLTEVIENLKNELNVSFEKLNIVNKKEHLNLLTEIIYLKNEITSNETRNENRMNTIINRYNIEKKNHLKLMNNKRSKINNQIIKLTNNIKGKQTDYNHLVNEQEKVFKVNKNNLNMNLIKFKTKSRVDKIKLTKKERKTLKRSYKFKSKQIKIESKR